MASEQTWWIEITKEIRFVTIGLKRLVVKESKVIVDFQWGKKDQYTSSTKIIICLKLSHNIKL